MAFSSTRVLTRISSRLQPRVLKSSSTGSASIPASIFKSTSTPKRASWISRLPVELGGVQTMLPLHSAIASARLSSGLSLESQAWGLVPQGISMPL